MWVMTEESLKQYPASVLVSISGRPERWHFGLYIKLKTTKSRNRTMILSYVSLQSCIYSLVSIPLQCKLLILATVRFKWPCIKKTNFWHRLIYTTLQSTSESNHGKANFQTTYVLCLCPCRAFAFVSLVAGPPCVCVCEASPDALALPETGGA